MRIAANTTAVSDRDTNRDAAGTTHEQCLVTGGTGFVGRQVVATLLDAGNSVTLLTRSGTKHKSIVADLTSRDIDLGDSRFSTVYQVAGLAHVVPRTTAERDLFFNVNVEGTRNLLRALERTGRVPEAFVLVSSVSVYGCEEGESMDEDTPRHAVDPYGMSKREAEDVVMEWGAQRGVRVGIVRLPLVVGKGAPGNLGMMLGALKRRRYLGVGDGSWRRSMVLLRDVANALPVVSRFGGVFNLNDGDHPSFRELENVLCQALERGPPFRLPLWLAKGGGYFGDALTRATGRSLPLTTRAINKMSSTLTFSDERARRVLGWRPARVLDHISELVA